MEDEEEIELPFTDEELQEKFDGKLEREINGPTYEVISKILKAVVQKKITVPGSFIGKIRQITISQFFSFNIFRYITISRFFLYVNFVKL